MRIGIPSQNVKCPGPKPRTLPLIVLPGPTPRVRELRSNSEEPAGFPLLNLDLDIDTSCQIETLKRIDRLWRRLDDVEKTLMDTHLEVLA